ncbi:MAG: hypothetical protein HQL32_08200 [Planctomycetes bacterium]|nr:hypothetical protein [Planctomycetota bacterium]
MKIFTLSFLPLLLCLIAGCSDSDYSSSETDSFELTPDAVNKGPIKAKVSLANKSISILEKQRLVLEIEAPIGIQLNYPSLEERLEDFRQVPWRSDEIEEANNLQQIKKYFAFELFESGEQIVPPFEIKYTSGSGENRLEGSLKTPMLKFHITAIDDPSLLNTPLEPPTDIMRPKPPPYLKIIALSLGGILIVILAIFLLDYYQKQKTAPPPPPPPAHHLAYAEIKALVKKREEDNMDGETFVAEISNILRRYIERRFQVRAYEQTTEEFLHQLLSSKGALTNFRDVLQQFLEFTDLVKFAAQNVKEEDVQQGFDFLKDFIEKTKLMGGAT